LTVVPTTSYQLLQDRREAAIHSLYMAVCILYVRADNCDNQVLLQELITLIT
jgi:hypothetical protein